MDIESDKKLDAVEKPSLLAAKSRDAKHEKRIRAIQDELEDFGKQRQGHHPHDSPGRRTFRSGSRITRKK